MNTILHYDYDYHYDYHYHYDYYHQEEAFAVSPGGDGYYSIDLGEFAALALGLGLGLALGLALVVVVVFSRSPRGGVVAGSGYRRTCCYENAHHRYRHHDHCLLSLAAFDIEGQSSLLSGPKRLEHCLLEITQNFPGSQCSGWCYHDC